MLFRRILGLYRRKIRPDFLVDAIPLIDVELLGAAIQKRRSAFVYTGGYDSSISSGWMH